MTFRRRLRDYGAVTMFTLYFVAWFINGWLHREAEKEADFYGRGR